MSRRLLTSLLAVVALSALGVADAPVPAAAALPTDVHVGAHAEYFIPSTVSIRYGGTVTWDFNETHTATDATPLDLYDSGLTSTGYEFTFVASGTYPFVCTIHAGMDGRVNVPVSVKPAKGPTGKTFTVVWASTAAPLGYVYDVQRRHGDGTWTAWRNGTTQRTASFVPAHKGTNRFRARLRDAGGSAASGWSPATVVTVG